MTKILASNAGSQGLIPGQGTKSSHAPGDGDGQGGLACCDSWGPKESDTTERLNQTELRPWEGLISEAYL